ncbi:MAG TPA: hypothetical protein VMR88_00260 [Candidatus Polarisedimenticolaceae bacterium]|nr:hypothetical protein [Candidatus Polarisedimenticolaceae bacterium]
MISPICIYTNEVDSILKHFKEDIMLLHRNIGVAIVGTWLTLPHNEFISVQPTKIRRLTNRRSER